MVPETELDTISCQICGNTIGVPAGAKEFVCPYCSSIYEVTIPEMSADVIQLLLAVIVFNLIPMTVGFALTGRKLRKIMKQLK